MYILYKYIHDNRVVQVVGIQHVFCLFNPLIPLINLISTAGLFKYVRPIS